jgi:hypothetical protein
LSNGLSGSNWMLGVAGALLVRPWLWPIAVAEMSALAPPGWWRRWPPVPRPAPKWLAFRLETQYGSGRSSPDARDVVAWLEWCRSTRRTW